MMRKTKITKPKTIILIQPKVGYTEELVYKKTMPLALLTIASCLIDEYEVIIINQITDRYWKKKLIKSLQREPICVGVTSMTGMQIKHALDISKIVKNNSKSPVVWGGIHATLFPKQTLSNRYIDYVVKGEGEITFRELSDALSKGTEIKKIKGVGFKEKGRIIINQDREFLDMDQLPDIPYELIDVQQHLPSLMKKPAFFIQTSRGCPYSCTFCFNTYYNKNRWRGQNSSTVLKNIERIVRDYDIGHFYFTDDNFFVQKKRAMEIVEGLIKRNLNIRYIIQGARINDIKNMSDEDLRKLRKSGCIKVVLGVESGSQKILDFINKQISLKDVVPISKKLRKFGIYSQYNFMLGLPGETMKDIRRTIEMTMRIIKSNPMAFVSYSIFVPYPQTPIGNLLSKKGFHFPNNLKDWVEYDYNNAQNINWIGRKQKRKIEALQYISLFIDNKAKYYSDTAWWIRLFSQLYLPIARIRFKYLLTDFHIELVLHRLFLKMIQKNKGLKIRQK